MERKFSVRIYLLAFIITTLVFLTGIYVGQLMTEQARQNIGSQVQQYFDQTSSIELMLLLDESYSFCPLYVEEFEKQEQRTIEVGNELTYLEEVKGITDEQLKKDYFLLEAKSYLIAKKLNENCGGDKELVLYFYSNEGCEMCAEQGRILSEITANSGNIRVYSFDGSMDSAVVKSFRDKYYIISYPTIIVNDAVYGGFQAKEKLLNILYEK